MSESSDFAAIAQLIVECDTIDELQSIQKHIQNDKEFSRWNERTKDCLRAVFVVMQRSLDRGITTDA